MKISTWKKENWKPFFCFEIYDHQNDGFINLVYVFLGRGLKFTWEFDGYIYKYRFEFRTDYWRDILKLKFSDEQKKFRAILKLWLDIKLGKKKIIGAWLYQRIEESKIREVEEKYWMKYNDSPENSKKYEKFREKSLIRINNNYYELIDEWGIEWLQNDIARNSNT